MLAAGIQHGDVLRLRDLQLLPSVQPRQRARCVRAPMTRGVGQVLGGGGDRPIVEGQNLVIERYSGWQNAYANLPGCHAHRKGKNDRSLITSDNKTWPLN